MRITQVSRGKSAESYKSFTNLEQQRQNVTSSRYTKSSPKVALPYINGQS